MAQPLPSTGYCPGFTGTMGVSDFLSGVWLPCFLHLSAILPVGRPDRISTVPPLSCVSSPVLRPRPLLSSSIVQMTAVACSVSDRIGKGNLYFGAESAGSLTPLTTLSPDVTASDPSLGNSADAAYCVGLTPTEQRELQSSWALTTRAALRRYAPSARARKKKLLPKMGSSQSFIISSVSNHYSLNYRAFINLNILYSEIHLNAISALFKFFVWFVCS